MKIFWEQKSIKFKFYKNEENWRTKFNQAVVSIQYYNYGQVNPDYGNIVAIRLEIITGLCTMEIVPICCSKIIAQWLERKPGQTHEGF